MLDQLVREKPGGELLNCWKNVSEGNLEYALSRHGEEVRSNVDMFHKNSVVFVEKFSFRKKLVAPLKRVLKSWMLKWLWGPRAEQALEIGFFRLSGECHKWMYDSLSLMRILEKTGFRDIQGYGFDRSRIPNFETYGLDAVDGKPRKPDSLYLEARKPKIVEVRT